MHQNILEELLLFLQVDIIYKLHIFYFSFKVQLLIHDVRIIFANKAFTS